MKTPFEIWCEHVAEQTCLYCTEPIGSRPYYQVPDLDGFAHAPCLAAEVECSMRKAA